MITVYTAVGYWASISISFFIGFLACAIIATGQKTGPEKIAELKCEVKELEDEVEYQKKIALGWATRVNDLETELNQYKIDAKA